MGFWSKLFGRLFQSKSTKRAYTCTCACCGKDFHGKHCWGLECECGLRFCHTCLNRSLTGANVCMKCGKILSDSIL